VKANGFYPAMEAGRGFPITFGAWKRLSNCYPEFVLFDSVNKLLELPVPIVASLYLDGHFVASGEAILRGPDATNSFLSTSGDIPRNFLQTEGILKLKGTNATLRLLFVPCCGCPAGKQYEHFHFRFKTQFESAEH
jgi:hypothetical protein